MAIEYVTQEALRSGRISGTIGPKSHKRGRASPSRSPTPAAAAAIANVAHPNREIRAIWGATVEESVADNGVLDGPMGNQVFLLDSDEAVKGWLVRTSHLVDRTVFIVYRRPEADGRPDTTISGDRPFFLHTTLVLHESEVYYEISEGEDEELVALRKEPRTFPWTRRAL